MAFFNNFSSGSSGSYCDSSLLPDFNNIKVCNSDKIQKPSIEITASYLYFLNKGQPFAFFFDSNDNIYYATTVSDMPIETAITNLLRQKVKRNDNLDINIYLFDPVSDSYPCQMDCASKGMIDFFLRGRSRRIGVTKIQHMQGKTSTTTEESLNSSALSFDIAPTVTLTLNKRKFHCITKLKTLSNSVIPYFNTILKKVNQKSLKNSNIDLHLESKFEPPGSENCVRNHTVHRIYMMLAFTLANTVGREQNSRLGAFGGYPVAALLVSRNGEILSWAVNTAGDNITQHAEMNMLHAYFSDDSSRKIPSGARIYTTLQPCNMCAGMIKHAFDLSNATDGMKVYYGQADPGSSNASALSRHNPSLETVFGYDSSSRSNASDKLVKSFKPIKVNKPNDVNSSSGFISGKTLSVSPFILNNQIYLNELLGTRDPELDGIINNLKRNRHHKAAFSDVQKQLLKKHDGYEENSDKPNSKVRALLKVVGHFLEQLNIKPITNASSISFINSPLDISSTESTDHATSSSSGSYRGVYPSNHAKIKTNKSSRFNPYNTALRKNTSNTSNRPSNYSTDTRLMSSPATTTEGTQPSASTTMKTSPYFSKTTTDNTSQPLLNTHVPSNKCAFNSAIRSSAHLADANMRVSPYFSEQAIEQRRLHLQNADAQSSASTTMKTSPYFSKTTTDNASQPSLNTHVPSSKCAFNSAIRSSAHLADANMRVSPYFSEQAIEQRRLHLQNAGAQPRKLTSKCPKASEPTVLNSCHKCEKTNLLKWQVWYCNNGHVLCKYCIDIENNATLLCCPLCGSLGV